MSATIYLGAVRAITEHIENTQLDAIGKAADLVIHALTYGGVVYCAEIGHGNQYDFLNRAGGLAALQHFTYSFAVNAAVPPNSTNRPREDNAASDISATRYAILNSNMCAGDVLMVSSVSGKGSNPIEMAMAAREIGVKTIGLTSMTYTANVKATHPSGKLLHEVVDVVIDNGAPYGDAVVSMPGYDYNVMPISGASMLIIGWLIWGTVMERMAAAGNAPTVFQSVNREGGQEFYNQCRKIYEERGY